MNPLEEARLGIRAVDKEIAALFERRMHLAAQAAAYKKSHRLPVPDPEQEARVLARGMEDIEDTALRGYYRKFLQYAVALSREYQETLGEAPPGITIGRGVLNHAAEVFDLRRKVLIVTEPGVPPQYAQSILAQCADCSIFTVPGGEAGKSPEGAMLILHRLLELGFTRPDAVVAVGGGMVTDLAGFAASVYMRGIDCYYVPTTLLSQVDASIGGKTAVNLAGIKNIVGTFRKPAAVLIDTATLDTLSPRLFAEGMAELVKMAATSSADLFRRIEQTPDPRSCIADLITEALRIKTDVVSRDPTEQGLRAVLNFGHTVGHAIEAAAAGSYHHGECVAMGMMYTSSGEARSRLESLLLRLGLPVSDSFETDTLMSFACRDKKRLAGGFKIVTVEEIGTYDFRIVSEEELRAIIEERKSQ